jgi:hypothetical protein
MDVDTAFLNSDSDATIYVDIPLGWIEIGQLLSKDDVAKLLKALYGLKQAPRLWQQFLAAALQELGFEPLDSDNCVYLNSITKVIIVTYVDDFLIIAKSIPAITELKELLASKFSIKELGPTKHLRFVNLLRIKDLPAELHQMA